ncbi:hypothetical protein HPT27_06250 [Permianibacter sp. IMCC34836]|uniref:hypothetical protein n=1 Tax=Permianibacter fluminis TaxID=2738515 RepID=UPI001553407E|nr:hypothetical protein [Permianibacter fluminis]NQD36619.1 hypothetical protein [Permianibacter fluminis]
MQQYRDYWYKTLQSKRRVHGVCRCQVRKLCLGKNSVFTRTLFGQELCFGKNWVAASASHCLHGIAEWSVCNGCYYSKKDAAKRMQQNGCSKTLAAK